LTSRRIEIPESELEFTAIRAQGAGGQNVNKVSNAVQLRFDAPRSLALPESCKERLRQMRDHRILADGVIVIKAQQFRSQEQNKAAAVERLHELLARALAVRKKRKPTKPSRAAHTRRLESKSRHGKLKRSRRIVDE
jgi:ribosome-associated protein